jgi:hypothetical protein
MRPSLFLAAGSALLAGAAHAQNSGVPRGRAIVSVISNLGASQGLWLAARGGTCVAVTGLAAAGSPGFGVNAVQLDPVDDRIWLGGINSNGNTAGQVNWCRIDNSTNIVTQWSAHGTVAGGASVTGLAFDDDGNPIASTGTATGGVFRISRSAGGAGVLLPGYPRPTGTHNAVARDASGNLYVGMFTTGEIYKSVKNADCTYAAAVLLGAVVPNSVAALEWCPPNNVIIGTFGTAGSAVFRMPDTGGAATVLSATARDTNGIEYDARAGDLWTVTAGLNPDDVKLMSKLGVETPVCTLQPPDVGSPSWVDTCDCPGDALSNVIPQCALTGTPFTLEVGTCCPPGDLGVVFLLTFNLPLVVGAVGGNGRISGSFPNLVLPLGTQPGSLQFISACLGSQFQIGPVTPWPAVSQDSPVQQVHLTMGGTSQPYSDWGSVDLVIPPLLPGEFRYVSIAIDGRWEIFNSPVFQFESSVTAQEITYNFSLGYASGTPVTHVNYAYQLTASPLPPGTVPPVGTRVGVGTRVVDISSGKQGGALAISPARGLVGDQVVAPAAFTSRTTFPNQECGRGECTPAAVSNSLQYLNTRNMGTLTPAQMSLATMKTATGWADPPGTAPADWPPIKDRYMRNNGYPITTAKTTDVDVAMQKLRDGCDVELDSKDHTAGVVGIVKLAGGKVQIVVRHDAAQGRAGGLKTEDVIWDPANGSLAGGQWFDRGRFDFFTWECWTPN